MAFEIITGPRLNIVGRGAAWGSTPIAGVSDELTGDKFSTRLPIGNLYNGAPAIPGEFWSTVTAGSATHTLIVAANLLACGDGEQATAVGWTGSAAGVTVATSATHAYRGAKSLLVTNGTGGTGYGYQQVTVQAGEPLKIDCAVGYQSAGITSSIEIVDPRGYYLNSTGTWQLARSQVVLGGAAFVAAALSFTAPTLSEAGDSSVVLEVRLHADGTAGGTAYGEMQLAPTVDFIGLFGHNIPSSATVIVKGYLDGDDASPATLATWASPRAPIGWYPSASVWGYGLYTLTLSWPVQRPTTSTTLTGSYIGELVLGKRLAFLQGPDYPVSVEWQHRQARSETPSGSSYALTRAYHPLRRVTMPLDLRETSRAQVRDSMLIASRFGADRCVLVPTEADSDLCILGRLRETATFARKGITTTACEIEVLEDALPTMA